MSLQRIFITGATGFVGASLVRHFAATGREVLANGRTVPPLPLLAMAKYVQADIEKRIPVQAADVVIHAAALASDAAGWDALKNANLEGTRHVFEATRDCPCFIYISSSSVYNSKKSLHQEDESVDRQRLSPYGRSKRLAEDWLLEQDWSKRSLYILRPRAVYGLGDRVLLPRMLRLVRAGQILSPGDMRISSSLTHVGNLCTAVELCIAQSSKGAQVFNVTDGPIYEMRSVVHQLLSEIHGKALPFRSLPYRPIQAIASILEQLHLSRQFTLQSLSEVSQEKVLDIQKISQNLGYQPYQDFWSVLPELVSWVHQVGLERILKAEADLPWSPMKTT